jgi:RND family efflux transporter MFP subunit
MRSILPARDDKETRLMKLLSRRLPGHQYGRMVITTLILLILAMTAGGVWFWLDRGAPKTQGTQNAKAAKTNKGPAIFPVTAAMVSPADVPMRLAAHGIVTPIQSVAVRPQITATIKAVHVREGQFVRQGEPLFSLDIRTEAAHLAKAEAQLGKSRTDLVTAERHLLRQRELFNQKFIAQTALDAAQNQVDSLRAQISADHAAVQASRVALGFGEIRAPISGRSGAVAVYPGSLVQPAAAALVTITQIDPVTIGFTLPERELPALQAALAGDGLSVSAMLGEGSPPTHDGKLVFIDNTVDSSSGTIQLKARFANPDHRLWPGMFINVSLAPRTLRGVLTVPVQAVQTGPEEQFVYVIDDAQQVTAAPIKVVLIQDGLAVIEGVAAGTRVVAEGAQNLRAGSQVSTARDAP